MEQNELNSSKTACQISRSIIDSAPSQQWEKNAITISLIVLPNNNLNSKAHEVNIQLITIGGDRGITFIDLTVTVDTERFLNESKLHLNELEKIEFTKNVWDFIDTGLIWCRWKWQYAFGVSNSISDPFRNSGHSGGSSFRGNKSYFINSKWGNSPSVIKTVGLWYLHDLI